MVKQKTNKVIAVMLVLAVMLTSLIAGAMLLAPKTSEVNAAEAGSRAILNSSWDNYLGSTGVTRANIVNLTISTTASKIEGYTKGTNIKDSTSQNDLYYYYQKTGTQVDTNADSVLDSDGYNVVIYADVETIYAPASSSHLFSLNEYIDSTYVSNLKTITFDNFNTINVTDRSTMFIGCTSLTSLDLRNFNTSNVTNMSAMFAGCSSLTTIYTPQIMGDCLMPLPNSYCIEGETTPTAFADSSYQNKKLVLWNSDKAILTPGLNLYELLLIETLNLTVTTNASDIVGYTNRVDVTSPNSAYEVWAYYKLNRYDVDNDVNLYDIVIYSNADTIYAPQDSSELFRDMCFLETLTFKNFNTSLVQDMSAMFRCTACGSANPLHLDLTCFDTSNVTDMSYMFGDMCCLETLNISSFDMSNVTDTEYMFGCACGLTQVNLPKTMGDTVIDFSEAGVELYVDGAGEAVTEIDSSIEGKILTLEGVTPVYPTPEAPDTPAGVDLIDIVIMGTLTLTLIIVCVAVLTVNKKRKLTNRNVTIENAKKLINKD